MIIGHLYEESYYSERVILRQSISNDLANQKFRIWEPEKKLFENIF